MTVEIQEKYKPQVPREVEVRLGKGVAGTLAIPHAFEAENPFEDNLVPATHKVALILHGQGGHRNYVYQKHLAHRLAHDLGMLSLRIDFRGCGDSADNADAKEGRALLQDVEDIQAAAEFIKSGELNGLGIDLTLSAVISHSRGGVAMFLWALEQDALMKKGDPKAIIVPNLINCAARYTSKTVLERYSAFVDYDYIPDVTTFRYGKYIKHDLSAREIITLSKPDFSLLTSLSRDWSCLSIYGLEDAIIPRYDSANFANALNRGPLSHTLKLIPDADHNFFGHKEIEPDDDLSDVNPLNLPLKGTNKVNYNFLVCDYIIEYLSPQNELERFLSSTSEIGSVPRWKNVEGVSNFRDTGGWRIHNPTFKLTDGDSKSEDADHHVYYVKPNYAFRCANVAGLTERGLETIQKLGIKAIFDLRSDGEIAKDGYPENLAKFGIERIHAPVYSNDDYSPQAIAIRYTNLMTSWSTYVNVYEDMLEFGVDSFKTVFRYILEQNKPFLFHCTAGKDRTGILGMLILLLAGVDKDTIGKEYELTTIGLKPDHPVLKSKFIETVTKLKEKLGGGEASDIENLISQGRKSWTLEDDGFNNLISSRYEAMLATIAHFNSTYGDIINYMRDKLGFNDEEIKQIYENLVVVDPQNYGFEVSSSLVWNHRNVGRAKF
ncbi:conserved hypothetical protein [Lodderomyces elongisporus NRRL YB-4239]|uniref:Tyrosine specific protein phosphatases domain-containing protein n=1 Tax=Lodderomyces elongisporus (strain ATCC 11503 / CBS 2605 / JCM 1781 / NBRC 1676 / NRRL YB-4239) TaxID=379508 RepID=A5E2J1_LODEL|nr:conserved hypothetical protein [Lodderomyces elongisporus NRRL YB-4239]